MISTSRERVEMGGEIPRSFSDGRYVVVKKLGEGGKGIVFKCSDEMLSRTVAVKMIKTSLDDETSSRFKREAQTTARLNHQNIVSVYDIGNVDNHPFLVIEYIDGKSLDDVIKEKSVLSPYDIVRISTAIAEALEYSHKQGILHRDIKPENVMISKDGIPKIMDFGLARSMDSPKLTHAGAIVGTPAFISPESALGKENDARSDLYSLGCVMYSMATGHPPFVSNDNLKLVYSHINDTPVPVRRIRHDFPEDLDNVIMKLLSKDPSSRYQSASDLLAVLRSLKYQENNPVHNVEKASPSASGISLTGFTISSGHQRRPLVGREMETSKVRSQIDAALTGMGSMIMVVGQTGTGKTRFLEEARAYASMRGFTVISVRCSKSKSNIPGQALSDLFREYISSQPMQLVYKICGDYADQMQKIVPEIAPRLGKVPEFPGLDAEQQRARMNEAVSVFIENMSRENPLFVSFDDIQFIDSFSLTFFRYYYEFVSSQRVVFMGASIPLDENSEIMKAMGEAIKARILEIIELGNLDRESTRLLISNYLGDRPDNLSDDFLNLVYRKSYGNPLFLEETLKYLIDRKQIYQNGDGAWEMESLSSINIPTSLKSIVRSKIEGLDDESLNLLKIASVIGQDFDYELLIKLSGIEDEDKIMNIVERLINRKFLSEKEGRGGNIRIYFTDPQVREILYEEVTMIRRKKLHENIARVIEKSVDKGNIDPASISALAEHFQEGGNFQKALEYRKMEADFLSSMAEFTQASVSYEKCLELLSSLPFPDANQKKSEAAMLHLKIASNLRGVEGGAVYKNARSAMDIFKEIGDDRHFIEAAVIYTIYASRDEADSAFEDIKRAVESISDSEETFEAKLDFMYYYTGYLLAQKGEIQEAKKVNELLQNTIRNNKEMVDHLKNKSIILFAELADLGFKEILNESDKMYVLERLKGLLDLADKILGKRQHALKSLKPEIENNLALFHYFVTLNLNLVRESLDDAIRISEQVGAHSYINVLKAERALAYSMLAEGFEAAKNELESIPRKYVVASSGTSHERHSKTLGRIVLSWYYLANGDYAELSKSVFRNSELSEMTVYPILLVIPELLYYLDTGQDDNFRLTLNEAGNIILGIPQSATRILPKVFIDYLASEAYVRIGQLENAKKHIGELKNMASSIKERWMSACSCRIEAVVAIHDKKFGEAEDKLKKSITIWTELGIRFFAGRDLLLLATVYHDSGNLGNADECLNRAMQLFSQIGATMYAQKVLSRKELLKA